MAKVSDGAVPMVEVWRGGLLESTHLGHAVICDADGCRRGLGRSRRR